MKKTIVFIFLTILLTGCSQLPGEMEKGMELRSKLLQSSSCSFIAKITADYGDKIHTFTMDCRADPYGDLLFTVSEPETISGITGKLSGEGGKLTFDDTVLFFELIAEDQLSPISAPWILLKTLRGGYITSACTEDGRIRLSIDESYEEDPLRLDIWLNPDNQPERADILHEGRRLLSVDIVNFKIM